MDYGARIKIAVSGQEQIDAAANSINRLQKLLDQVSRGVVLTGADPKRLSAGWDAVANSISRANRELRQFASTARELQRLRPVQVQQQRALPPGVQGGALAGSSRQQALPPGSSIPASQQVIDVSARRVADAAGDFAQAVQRGAQRVETASAGGGGRGFYPPGGGQGSFFPPGGGRGGFGGFPGGGSYRGRFPSDGMLGNPFNPPTRGPRGPRIAGNMSSAFSSAAIGGGFPLLFGQGAGTAVGGLLGGFGGGAVGGAGGFAGGIIGSLIGTQFDKIKANAIGLADALKAPSEALVAMEAAGIKVGGALKNTVAALEETGRSVEAQALVFAELERLGGSGYVQNLLELEEANKELQASWSKMSVVLMDEMLPAIILLTRAAKGFADFIANSDVITRWAGIVQASPGGAGVGMIARLLQGQGLGEAAANTGAQVQGGVEQLLTGQGPPETRNRQPPPVSDTDQRRALDEAIARQKEAEDLRRRGIDLDRANTEFRRDQEEAIYGFRKRATDMERDIAEFRRETENKLLDRRDALLRKQADLIRQEAQIGIDRADLGLRQASQIPMEQGGGQSQLVNVAREYLRVRAEGEADLAQKERIAALDSAKLSRETTKFKLDVEKKVYEFNQKAADYKRDVDRFGYETQQKIYKLTLDAADYRYALWEREYKMAATLEEKRAAALSNPLGDVSGSAGNPNNTTQYMRRMSLLESDGGKNWTNPSSGAAGFFQFLPSTLKDLPRLGLKASDAMSKNFDTAAKAALDYAEAMQPGVKALIAAGRFAEADKRLNRLWTSLPGGAEQASPERMNRANALLAGGGRQGGAYIEGNIGPTSTGEHFDVKKKTGGKYFERNALDLYVEVNGKPLSSGTTVPGGTFSGHQARGSHGWDYAFGEGRHAATLKGGAKWLGGSPTAHGEAREFQLPNGDIYQFLHGKSEGIGAGGGAMPGGIDIPSVESFGARPTRPGMPAGLGAIPQAPSAPDASDLIKRNSQLSEREQELIDRELSIARQRQELTKLAADVGLEEGTAAVLQQYVQPLLDANQAMKDRAAYQREYGGLVKDGMLPAQAEALSQLNQLEATQLRILEIERTAVRSAQERLAAEFLITKDAARRLEIINAQRALEGQAGALDKGAQTIRDQAAQGRDAVAQQNTPQQRLQDEITQRQAGLNTLIDPVNQLTVAADGLGSAFSNAFQDIASGSKSAQQALSDMFSNIASSFLKMAADMLAQQAVLGILKLVAGGTAGGGDIGAFGNSGILGLGSGALGFRAEGGPVDNGKSYIVGERGPELFVPKASGAIVPASETRAMLERGATALRTKAADEERQAMMASTQNSTMQVEWKKVGDMDVITREEFLEGMAATERQAAKRGQAMVVSSMRRDPGFRKEMR